MQLHDLYGVVVASEHRFATPLNPAADDAVPDVVVTVTDEPADVDWSTAEQVDAQGRRADGEPDFVFARLPGRDAVRITGALDVLVADESIDCHVLDPRHLYLIDIALLGMVLSFWLERRGTPTLHASVAVVEGGAVGFLGAKGAGKTSTLAACLARGHALLTDDLLALRREPAGLAVPSGFPALRLWPAQVEHFVGPARDLPVVHPDFAKLRVPVGDGGFGGFHGRAAPLRRLYLPRRLPDPDAVVRIERLGGHEAVMALVRHSFLPREVQRFGWQDSRLRTFAELVGQVPVATLQHPSGFDRLPDVVDAVERDVARTDR